jgi:hypothetical protein
MKVAVRKLRIDDVAKLQSLVVEHFDTIEPGLTVLDARLLLGHATIDVIGVDAKGALVLVAVGFTANEEMLLKAVEAYSWCLEYPEALVRLYPSCQVSEDRPPRLLFVVERMPDAFHRKIKQMGFPEVDCVEFRHLEFDGVPTVYFESLLCLRRNISPAASRVAEPDLPAASASGSTTAAGENVIMMNGAAARVAAIKHPKVATQAIFDAGTAPRASERAAASREPAPVVSMVTRHAALAAPLVERPHPADEPITLREPEPLVSEPLGAPESDPIAASLRDIVADLGRADEPSGPPAMSVPQPPESPGRPVAPGRVPTIAPAHVVTATASAPERVSFKDMAGSLLGGTTEALERLAQVAAVPVPSLTEPSATEPVVEPATAPLELALDSSLADQIAPPGPRPERVEPPIPVQRPRNATALTPPAAVKPVVAEAAKPSPAALPQGFEGLKFPNDGVLTRQWMEFLSQMSATK